jgi:hypothetical protein
MRNRILTALFLLITSHFTCDCEWEENFIYSSKFTELIVCKGKVVENFLQFLKTKGNK